AHRQRRRGELRPGAGRAGARSRLRRGFLRRGRRELRADRSGAHRRGPGDRGARGVRRRRACRNAGAGAQGHRRADAPAAPGRGAVTAGPLVTARRFSGDTLVVATHNPGKATEIADLLAPFAITVVTAGALGLPEPEETGSTFEANATLKALAAA